jgi:hypothetical protein
MAKHFLVAVGVGLVAGLATWWAVPRFQQAPLQQQQQPPAVDLRVSLVAGGRELLNAPGRVALPANATFHVRATATVGGVLEVWTANAQGQPAARPLYTSAVLPGQVIDSPDFRFAPPAGTETLQVRLRADARGVVAERAFQVWHP